MSLQTELDELNREFEYRRKSAMFLGKELGLEDRIIFCEREIDF